MVKYKDNCHMFPREKRGVGPVKNNRKQKNYC